MVYSYSSMATFKQCPQKFKFAYIDKVEVTKLPPSPALERGTAVHESVDSYINRTTEYLHPDIHKNWGQYLHSIRESSTKLHPEFAWGITWEYEPCHYDDPKAMLHGYIDLLGIPEDPDGTIDIYEWKTGGKYADAHTDQIHLYSVAMLCHYPDREWVDAVVVYFDGHSAINIKYPKSMLFEYKPALRREVGLIADATRFPAKPSFKCKWCPYSRIHNQGPCNVG